MTRALSFFASCILFVVLVFAFLILRGQQSVKEPDKNLIEVITAGNFHPQSDLVYTDLPFSFLENTGQVDEAVQFISQRHSYTLFLQANKATFSLKPSTNANTNFGFSNTGVSKPSFATLDNQKNIVEMKMIGANPNPIITGLEKLPYSTNYFIGNERKNWKSNISNYSGVKYKDLYQGIDLIYYSDQKQLKYDFIVAPGADPNSILLDFSGLKGLKIDVDGSLVIQAARGQLRKPKPYIYQNINDYKIEIPGKYEIVESTLLKFSIGEYNQSEPLIIDPVIIYSTFLGGSGTEATNNMAVDVNGFVYVIGVVQSVDLPTVNPIQSSTGGNSDIFVAKIDPTGSSLVYVTYLGGTSFDFGRNITTDDFGNAYITGSTSSPNFPTINAFQPNQAGLSSDCFVAKINSDGSSLVYSTYLGGGFQDSGQGIAVDNTGCAYITGSTGSSDFPILNAFQSTKGGISNTSDAFVTKLSATGNSLIYSTFLGGSDPASESGLSIAVDNLGNAYVTGQTRTTDFPVFNALQPTIGDLNPPGNGDAFVTKLNPSGNGLIFSTYLGGEDGEAGQDIVVDGAGNVYLTGSTGSTNFPTVNAIQSNLNGYQDAIVVKINTMGSALEFSTYLGGSDGDSPDIGFGIALDAAERIYVSGGTGSVDFPLKNPIQSVIGSGGDPLDAFVTCIDPTSSSLLFSTYIGGDVREEEAAGIGVDAIGNIYISGSTSSIDFPVNNPIQPNLNGPNDIFITKISPVNLPPIAVPGPNQTVLIADTVQLDGSNSNDPDNNPIIYNWLLLSKPLGSNANLFDPSLTMPSFVADSAGEYTVQLIVNDGLTNSTPEFVTIIAQTEEEAILDIVDDVQTLFNEGILNNGQSNALQAKLQNAISKLDKGNETAASNQLQAFINQVNGFLNSGVLSIEEGQPLIDAANIIISHINSSAAKQSISGDELKLLPQEFSLFQNYPNPFNPATSITYELSYSSHVEIEIFNLSGQLVKTIINQHLTAGKHTVTWDGTNTKGNVVSSGIYLYRLKADNYTETKRLVLLR